jgi:UPF0755 protein
MKKSNTLVWILLPVVLLLLAGAFGVSVKHWFEAPVITQDRIFEVPRGVSVARVAQLLQQQLGLQHPLWWSGWIRIQRMGGKIKAGEYQLRAGMTPLDLQRLLTSGEFLLHSITVVEGTTFAEFRHALAMRDDVDHAWAALSDAEIMRQFTSQEVSPEAQFFPDTYRFVRGARDADILRRAYERMQSELDSAWQQRDPSLSLTSPYQALILASIVEKESALSSERPVIAGVFLERLARNMRLQTDPTVIYGLGDRYDGSIHKDDLLRDTPYNTYTREGLPPTPICLPGASALKAVMNPQRTGAIYFVASDQGDGSHYFSHTLAEHNAAVQRYLRKLRQHRP